MIEKLKVIGPWLTGKRKPHVIFEGKSITRRCWDIEGFTTQLEIPVRVVRSLKVKKTLRQINKEEETKESDWVWVTTIPEELMGTEAVIELGHKRWDIENKAFNELVTYWHADHIYRHTPVAIEAFWLLTMLAYNLFHAFICLNLKPVVRKAYTKEHIGRLIAAELYRAKTGLPENQPP